MIEILIALLMFLGYSKEEIDEIQSQNTSNQQCEGLGSTAGGVQTILIGDEVWEIYIDEKGNYQYRKK